MASKSKSNYEMNRVVWNRVSSSVWLVLILLPNTWSTLGSFLFFIFKSGMNDGDFSFNILKTFHLILKTFYFFISLLKIKKLEVNPSNLYLFWFLLKINWNGQLRQPCSSFWLIQSNYIDTPTRNISLQLYSRLFIYFNCFWRDTPLWPNYY